MKPLCVFDLASCTCGVKAPWDDANDLMNIASVVAFCIWFPSRGGLSKSSLIVHSDSPACVTLIPAALVPAGYFVFIVQDLWDSVFQVHVEAN